MKGTVQSTPLERLYTLNELVEQTGLSAKVLRSAILSGMLRAVQPSGQGGALYVGLADYRRAKGLEDQAVGPDFRRGLNFRYRSGKAPYLGEQLTVGRVSRCSASCTPAADFFTDGLQAAMIS